MRLTALTTDWWFCCRHALSVTGHVSCVEPLPNLLLGVFFTELQCEGIVSVFSSPHPVRLSLPCQFKSSSARNLTETGAALWKLSTVTSVWHLSRRCSSKRVVWIKKKKKQDL
ncbi:hypothetical protein BaRGS_00006320 [Batillaria attramentaria]|uniref:Secreted protein n=1 Tax=Batillaria attramentaria TaxID=370345 RepID=A0ABD0LSE9_9CAEN